MAHFLAQGKICASEAISADEAGMLKEAATLYDAAAELISLGKDAEFNKGVRSQLLQKIDAYKARSVEVKASYETLREQKRIRAQQTLDARRNMGEIYISSSLLGRGSSSRKADYPVEHAAQTSSRESEEKGDSDKERIPVEVDLTKNESTAMKMEGPGAERKLDLEEEVDRLRRLTSLQEEIVEETKAEMHRLRGIVDGQHSTIRALSRGREIKRDAYISGIEPSTYYSSPSSRTGGVSPFKVWSSYEPPYAMKPIGKKKTATTAKSKSKSKSNNANSKSKSPRRRSKSPYEHYTFTNPVEWDHRQLGKIPNIFDAEANPNKENMKAINRSMTKGKTPFSEGRKKDREMKAHAAARLSRSPQPDSGRVRICLACNHNGDMPSPPTELPKKLKSALKKGVVNSRGSRSRSPKATESLPTSPTRFKFNKGAQLASEADGIVAQINAALNPPKKPYVSPGRLSISSHERLVEDDLDLSLM